MKRKALLIYVLQSIADERKRYQWHDDYENLQNVIDGVRKASGKILHVEQITDKVQPRYADSLTLVIVDDHSGLRPLLVELYDNELADFLVGMEQGEQR